MKVLVADDDRSARALLASSLARWGYGVALARDGQEALQILRRDDPPRLVLTDRCRASRG